jgi:hypothetical protein
MKLFNNPKKTVIFVVSLLVLAFAYRGCHAGEAHVELGPTFTGEFNGGIGLMYTERFGRFDLGIMLIGEQKFEGKTVPNNGGVNLNFVMHRPDHFWPFLPDEIHVGPSAWIDPDDDLVTGHLGYNLGVRWNIGKRFHIGIRHWSNAGTKGRNRGQDLLVFGLQL